MRAGDVVGVCALILVVLLMMIAIPNLTATIQSNSPLMSFTDLLESTLGLATIGIIIAAAVGILSLMISFLTGDTHAYHELEEDPLERWSHREKEEEKVEHPLTWTCQYCMQVNNWDDKKCFVCGAPRKQRLI